MTTDTGDLADGAIADVEQTYQLVVTVSEAATASDQCSIEFVGGTGGLGDSAIASVTLLSLQTTYHLSVAGTARARDSVSAAVSIGLTANAVASDSVLITPDITMPARAVASDQVTIETTYNIDMVASARATDGVDNRTGILLSANATASDSVSFAYIGHALVDEVALATDQLTPTWVGNPSIHDAAVASEALATSITYEIRLTASAVASELWEPNAGTTTWVVNTRTNAVTQYRNYVYNSFASVGRKYIAANEAGLYELLGAQDDTQPVIGDFSGGFMEPNPGKMAGFKGVYMAARGSANWQLELKAGDGREYVYQRQTNPGLMTTKFDIGKGLHSRFFAWRLTAIDGQDFDFASLELVPSMSGRRIG